MSNYSTQAVLASAPLLGVPDHVYRALVALTSADLEELKVLFDELNDAGALRQSLIDGGLLADSFKLDSARLWTAYEEASGNTILDEHTIMDDGGDVVMGVGGVPAVYSDDLAREYLYDCVLFADDDIETACGEATVTRYADGDAQDGVYLHWEESFSDCTSLLLQWLLRQLPESVTHVQVDAAHVCDRWLADGFGGFALIITRDDAHWLSTSTAATRMERVVLGKVEEPTKILEELGLEEDLLDVCASFIKAQGLDQEFRKYVADKLKGSS